MVKKCVICGNLIRTGRKYCYEHRNISQESKMRVILERKLERQITVTNVAFIIGIILIFLFIMVSINGPRDLKGILLFFGIIGLLAGFLGLKEIRETKKRKNDAN
ncbi:hypothetical protein K8R47_01985 [archaeon]|nr:hypothetical protein [archaeon]